MVLSHWTDLVKRQINGVSNLARMNRNPRRWYPRIEQLEDRHLLAPCVVRNTNPTGPESLRQRIIEANLGQCDNNQITFNTGGGGVAVISPTPTTILDPITRAGLLIDGTTQPRPPGDTGTSPIIVLNGQFAGTGVGAIGLRIETQGVTVKGLAIVGFDNVGLFISGTGAKDNRVLNSYIGVDHTGQVKVGNGTGVSIQLGSGNYIGGVPGDQVSCPTDDKQRTIISGNKQYGVSILGANKNVICNTYIGLAKDGSTALGNEYAGVNVGPDSSENRIGGRVFTEQGTIISPANVISGNSTSGVRIEGPGAGKNYVNGNFIGTNSAGTLGRGNGTNGIEIVHS